MAARQIYLQALSLPFRFSDNYGNFDSHFVNTTGKDYVYLLQSSVNCLN